MMKEIIGTATMDEVRRYLELNIDDFRQFLGEGHEDGISDSAGSEEKVERCLTEMCIPKHILGYRFLLEAAVYYKEVIGKEYRVQISKDLYPHIAEKFHATSSSVERAIRHAIEIAWSRNPEKVCNVLGYKFQKDRQPSNSELIAALADLI